MEKIENLQRKELKRSQGESNLEENEEDETNLPCNVHYPPGSGEVKLKKDISNACLLVS